LKLSLEKEKTTLNDLRQWPEQQHLQDAIDEITDSYNAVTHELKLWNQRHKHLLQLHSDMKTIHSSNTTLLRSMSSSIYNKQSSRSYDNPSVSPSALSPPNSTCPSPYPTSPSPTRTPTRPKFLSSQSFSENLALQLNFYPDLKGAFLPLIGRESTLLPPTSTVAECVRHVSSCRFLSQLFLIAETGSSDSSKRRQEKEI
jgi:hypothetical protein